MYLYESYQWGDYLCYSCTRALQWDYWCKQEGTGRKWAWLGGSGCGFVLEGFDVFWQFFNADLLIATCTLPPLSLPLGFISQCG